MLKESTMEEEKMTMEIIIDRLKEIDKDQLTEREFFYDVLNVIRDMNSLTFKAENFDEFSKTLEEIGCTDYNRWMIEKEKLGFKEGKRRITNKVEEGALSAAAEIIGYLVSDPENVKNRLEAITNGGDNGGLVQVWLKRSRAILNKTRISPDFDYEMEKEVFSKERENNRMNKQNEIPNMEASKALLKAELEDIMQQIKNIEIEKSSLNKRLEEKQEELNTLEEK